MSMRQESWLVHFFRAAVLLIALIAVPGVAVCWNLIPKDIFHGESKEVDKNFDSTTFEKTNDSSEDSNSQLFLEFPATDDGESVSASPSELFSHDFLQSGNSTNADLPSLNHLPVPDSGKIKTMNHAVMDDSTEQQIPVGFDVSGISTTESAVWTEANQTEYETGYEKAQSDEISDGEMPAPKRILRRNDFPALEKELKDLGAKYYRLEKWGSRGDLFRFSCYVSPSSPNQQYQKYFQAIDSDELRVMRRVVEDIRLWKEKL